MMTNIMIAGSILNFVNDLCTGSTTQADVSGTDNFEALMKKSMFNSLNNDLTENAAQTEIINRNGSGVYLEKLRNDLLAKGKSLDKIYLKDSDIQSLTTFLTQCGYSKIEAKQCIDKLLGNDSDGKIKLSDIFSEIEKHLHSRASESSEKKSHKSLFLEPSVIPGIESALKDLGLSLKDADNILNSSRSTSGGIDLDKLISQLKNAASKDSIGTEEKISAVKFLEKHGNLGLHITPDQETGNISINGFVAALEQFRDSISGKEGQNQKHRNHNNGIDYNSSESKDDSGYKGDTLRKDLAGTITEKFAEVKNSTQKLPMDVKASIDRIVEKAVAPDEQFKLKLNEPSLSQLKSGVLQDKDKTNYTGHILQGDQIAEPAKRTGNQRSNHRNQVVHNTEAARKEGPDRLSDLNDVSFYKKDVNSEKDFKDLKLKSADVFQDGNPSFKFETFSSALQTRSANNFLPSNTVEWLGIQISRSVARGDRLINLQLTPPELGTIKLSLEIKDSTLKLNIITESALAKEVLLNNSHDLKSQLADQGIKLDRLDVQVGSDSGNALVDLNKGFSREHQYRQETGGSNFSEDNIKEDISSDVLNKAVKDYLLDLTA